MIDALPLLLGPEGYQISRSVRLRSSASAYFNRTPASASNRKTWTWSGWAKLGNLGDCALFQAYSDANNRTQIGFGGNQINFSNLLAGSINARINTNAVYRDPSAWYHIVAVYDSTDATSSNRMKLYVNGVQQTSLLVATYPAQNTNLFANNNIAHYVGRDVAGSTFDGYLTEINFIDGQALTPSSFGQNDPITGVWQPKKYTGTYGTNGFYLNFSDNSAATAAAIGKDYSGNGNNWTPNNITLSPTTSTSYDSMLDVPTPWADGGNGRGNYATLNPLSRWAGGGSVVLSDGNLKAAFTNQYANHGTIAVSSGKYYWEAVVTSAGINSTGGGIMTVEQAGSNTSPYLGWVLDVQAGRNYYNNSYTSLAGGSFASGDRLGVAVNMDNGKIWYAKNGTWLGTSADPAAGTGAAQTNVNKEVVPVFYEGNTGFSATWEANFGQRPFSYTPPTGFKALNTQNLPDSTIKKGGAYHNEILWTGNGATTRNLTGTGFQPDLLWIKRRDTANSHQIVDSGRGASLALASDLTNAEFASQVGSFDSDGFSLASAGAAVNASGGTYVGWQWKKGATQGFDIVTYTGTGANRTVAHNLGVDPRMIILKSRTSGTAQWVVYHGSLSNTQALYLNASSSAATSALFWNSTSPTSSVFSLGTSSDVNVTAQNYVAYLFAGVAGFSKFGSYTGNGSADGPFVFCGFRPRWVMIKRTDVADNWYLLDTARAPSNQGTNYLGANQSVAEQTGFLYDALSNGFKLRYAGAGANASGGTYIFAAFAENPFKYSLAR